ncbi:P-loop containing nucleoside triphosphate hydrolase protein [Pyronema domesticum]|uniref:Similar to Ras-related protein RABB1b acc. no. Q38922 n=1 Tax=Pyronema omphalodes (strain CBS 100304) TaxID=1076935 RepID=U4KZN2_PYROM|nr:P-loop containing nucleoside triphosphate hydrolase protein [Pyronema domesticum]CCX07195.1 Similar to Ras-related protein RABB1b; acc. no. Q38922 [Pyronema omphalodes CBS 100304]
MPNPPYDYIAKIVNIGDSGCGKSSLTIRLCESRFDATPDVTVGVQFDFRIIPLSSGKAIKLQIWDTAGQECYRSVTKSYFRGATGALLVYDITRRETFEHAKDWLDELRGTVESDEQIAIILVGNKTDLEAKRQVTKEEAEQWAVDNKISAAVETSAKTGDQVEEAFLKVAEQIGLNIEKGVYDLGDKRSGVKKNPGKPSMGIEERTGKQGGGCC